MSEIDELLRQKEELASKIRQIDSSVAQILQAIKNQRWYFFDNQPSVIFDSNTALIWANLHNFSQVRYSWANSYKEVYRFISNLNSVGVDGYRKWRVPTAEELWELVEDTTFPFCNLSRRINNEWCWCVTDEGILKGKDLDINGETRGLSNAWNVHVIPCCGEIITPGFTAEPQEILNIFVGNNLQPKFANKEVNKMYRQLNWETRQRILRQIQGLDARILELQRQGSSKFDYRFLLEKFDVAAINNSVIRYYEATLKLAEEVLAILEKCKEKQLATGVLTARTAERLAAEYASEPYFTAEENSMLAARQKFLAQFLGLRLEEWTRQIYSIRAEAENFAERINKINRGKNILRELAALEAEPRASFAFLAENMAQILKVAQAHENFCAANRHFVSELLLVWENWNNSYRNFKTKQRDEFMSECRKNLVEEKLMQEWYEEWRELRFKIESKFLPLVEFSLQGNLLTPKNFPQAFKALEILREYKNIIDKFYRSERLGLYRKLKGKPQEKIAVARLLNVFFDKFRRSIQTIILNSKRFEERIFLEKWAGNWQ